MNVQSVTCKQMTFEDLCEFTCSAELQVGNLPCASPVGLTSGPCGREAAPANPSPSPEKEKGSTTSATSGRYLPDSSPSAALTLSLGSRLQARLGTGGLMEYTTTWKQKVTPAGRRYWVHTASVRRISVNVCIGSPLSPWPTCTVHDSTRQDDKANGNAATLARDVVLWVEPWPTATTRDWTDTGNLENVPMNALLGRVAALASWATPNWHDGRRPGADVHSTQGANLSRDCLLADWPTPNAMGGGQTSRGGERKNELLIGGIIRGIASSLFPAAMVPSVALNPGFSRWLMGFPAAWEQAAPGWTSWASWQQKISDAVRCVDTATP